MKAQPRLDEKYVVVIVRECLYALSFLHKSGIMHRDIKGIFFFLKKISLFKYLLFLFFSC